MATYYWAASGVAAFNSANWATSDGGASGFGPPGVSDTAVFKGDTNSNENCTITADFTIASLDMRNNYAGSFRTDGGSYSLTVTGDCAFGCSALGDVKLGTGASWYIGGNLYTNQVLGDLLPLTSTVRLTGSNNTILQGSSLSDAFYILQVDKTSTGGVQLQSGDLDCASLDILDGDFDLNENDITVASHFRVRSGATWTQSTTSTITLDGTQATANTFTYDEVDPIILNRTASGGILQAGPLAARSLTMIDGIWETAGYDVTTSGDIILDCDTVNSTGGGGTWTIGGNFDWQDVGTWAPNNNTVFDMTGSNKYLLGTNGVNLTNLTITGSIYIHASTVLAIDVIDDIVIDGTLTIDSGRLLRVGGETGNLYVNTTGTITGDGTVYFISMRSGYGLILTGGYDYDINTVFFNPRVGCYIPPGVYSKTIKIHGNVSTSTWQPITGTYTFQSNLQISAIPEADTPVADNTLNIDNRSAQPEFIVEGNLILQHATDVNSTGYDGLLYIYNNHATLDIDWTFSGDVNTLQLASFYWYAGTGTLEFIGSNNHILDLYNETIEAVVVDKSGGTLTLDYHINPASFQLTAGTFDADIYDVDIDGTGDITLVDGEIYMGSGEWTCNGNIDLSLVTVANFNMDTAKLIMGGSGKYIIGLGTDIIGPYAIEFSTGSSITIQTLTLVVNNGSCTVNGTLNILTGLSVYGSCATIIGASANVTGEFMTFYSNHSGGGLTSYASGKLNLNRIYFRNQAMSAAIIPNGVYNCNINIECPFSHNGGQNYIRFSPGTITINGHLNIRALWATYSNHIDNNINHPNLIISGYFSSDQSGDSYTYWSKGNGLITLTGSAYISHIATIGTLDAIKIDASGTRILYSDFDCQSLLINGGTFDANDHDVTINDFFRMENGTICYAGVGSVWTVDGNWDLQAIGNVNGFYAETSEIKLTGVGFLEVSGENWYNAFHRLTISGSYAIPSTSGDVGIHEGIGSWLKITFGGILLVSNNEHLWLSYLTGTNVYIEEGGELAIEANATVQMFAPASGYGIQQNDGQITGAGEFQFRDFAVDNPIAPGIYPNVSCYAKLVDGTTQFDAGTFTINGNLKSYSEGAGNHVLDIGTNSPTVNVSGDIIMLTQGAGTANITRAGATTDWDIGGDWVLTGGAAKTYTKSAARSSITVNGTGTQNLNFSAGNIEDLIIDKAAGTAVLDSNVNMEALTIETGNFDANDYNITIIDFFQQDSGTVCQAGTGIWDVGGSWDTVAATASGSFLAETGEIKLTGSGTLETYCWDWVNPFHRLTVSGIYTMPPTSNQAVIYQGTGGWLKISDGGKLTLDGISPDNFLLRGSSDLIVESSGELAINSGSWLYMYYPSTGYGIPTNDGQITGAGEVSIRNFDSTNPLDAGIYPHMRFHSSAVDATVIFGAGTFTINGDFELDTGSDGTVTADMSTNAPSVSVSGNIALLGGPVGTITRAGVTNNWNIGKDFSVSGGPHAYIKGAAGASITANGTGTQNLDFSAGDIEDLIIDKTAGTVFLTGNIIADSFLGANGEIDFNGQTLETIGDFTINSANSAGFSVVSDADAMNAVDITVGNDFYVSNITFNATSTWYLDVQGSSALAFNVSVKYSDANVGRIIDATAPSNTDLGVNYNWDFGALPDEAVSSVHSLSIHCFPWTRLTNRSIYGFRRR